MKYEILVLGNYEGVYEIEANSFKEACNELERKINDGEIYLSNTDTYERILKNNNSRKLMNNINMYINYDYDSHKVKILHNDYPKVESDWCYTVRDLMETIENYCETKMEDNEIPLEFAEVNKIAIRNNFKFLPVDLDRVDFFYKLTMTDDKVKIDGEVLNVFCAVDYDTALRVDDFFGNNIGYNMEEYLIKNNYDEELSYE